MSSSIIVLGIFLGMIGLSVLLAALRLIKGPNAASRAVAVDVLTIITTVLIVFSALYFKKGIFLDIALVYSLLSYIGVLALARYIEKGM